MTFLDALRSGKPFKRIAWPNWWTLNPSNGWETTTIGSLDTVEPTSIHEWSREDFLADDFVVRQ
jgi:hypothetical protein